MFDPTLDHRRSIRLKGYDYATGGGYYITLCVQDRVCRFGEVVNEEVRTNPAGQMIHAVWAEMPDHYPGVVLDAFVVMPNHLHGIVVLQGSGAAASMSGESTPLSLSDVVHRFKTLTTKRYTEGVKQLGWTPYRARVWQRNYFEHIIRDAQELEHIRRYIAENPARWGADPQNPQACGPPLTDLPWQV